MTEDVFARLRELLIEKREIDEQISLLRAEIESAMRANNIQKIERSGIKVSMRKNSPTRRVDWARFENEFGTDYQRFLNSGVITIKPPKNEYTITVRLVDGY